MTVVFVLPALACQPGDNEYDNAYSPGAFVVRAQVIEFSREAVDGQACYAGKYDAVEVMLGKAPTSFEPKECFEGRDEVPVGPNNPDVNIFGFVAGAEVLAGFAIQPRGKGLAGLPLEPGSLRFLVPDCWRPAHLRIDQLQVQSGRNYLSDGSATSVKGCQSDEPDSVHAWWCRRSDYARHLC
ncbi:MAG: hypothetical protein AB7P20_11195 [Rhizobiaceae bacterium]